MKTLRLYHPHTHEGVAYAPPPEGIELTVNAADAAFLQALGLTTPPPSLKDTPAHEPVVETQADVVVDVAIDEDTAA